MRISRFLLSLVLAAASASAFAQAGVFPSDTLDEDLSFKDELSSTSMTLAYDGSQYWSSSGGGPTGERLAQYSNSGSLIAKFAPGLDFRSVFAQGGTLYARQFSDASIYQQTAPGTFSSAVSLTNLTESQAGVVLNGTGDEYIALVGGSVSRWSLSGAPLASVALAGFGSLSGEDQYPQNRGIAAQGNHWFTYSGGIVSAWDATGQRVGQATLVGAGTSFDSHFSFSFANGRFWVVDQGGAAWRGYPLVIINMTPANLPAGQVGVPYSQTLAADGGTAPYTWSAIGLPAGLSMGSGTGIISGTPTEPLTAAVTVSVADSAGHQRNMAMTLVVDPLDVTVSPSLPNGKVGAAYSANINVSGGIAPYTLVLNGELPEGLSLDLATGAITGTPTKVQTSSFSITVSDSSVVSAEPVAKAAVNSLTQSYTITITADAKLPTPVPALGAWGLLALSTLLILLGWSRNRQRTV